MLIEGVKYTDEYKSQLVDNDPYDVAIEMFTKEAEKAIKFGKDPSKVYEKRDELVNGLIAEKQKLPKNTLQKVGRKVASTLTGVAMSAREDIVQNVDMAVTDMLDEIHGTDVSDVRRRHLERQNKQFEKTMLGQLAAENPIAKNIGKGVGTVSNYGAMATAGGSAARAAGTKLTQAAPIIARQAGKLSTKALNRLKTAGDSLASGAAIGGFVDPGEEGSRAEQAALTSGLSAGLTGIVAVGKKMASGAAKTAISAETEESLAKTLGPLGIGSKIRGIASTMKDHVRSIERNIVPFMERSKEVRNNIYNKYVYGPIDDKIVDLTPIKSGLLKEARKLVSGKSGINPENTAVSKKIIDYANTIKGVGDTVFNVRTTMGNLKKAFNPDGSPSSSIAGQAERTAKEIYKDALRTTAKRFGRDKQLAAADKVHQEYKIYDEIIQPLETKIKETVKGTEYINVKNFSKEIHKLIKDAEKGEKILPPLVKSSVHKSLKGLDKLIEEFPSAAKVAQGQLRSTLSREIIKQGAVFGTIAASGYLAGLSPGTAVGIGATGMIGMAALLRTTKGVEFLKAVADMPKNSPRLKDATLRLIQSLSGIGGTNVGNEALQPILGGQQENIQ